MQSYELYMAIKDTGTGGKPETIQTWHQRLGHLNKRDIGRLQNMAMGINIGTPVQLASVQCTGCLVGKDHRQISQIPRRRATQKLEIIHMDICRPMQLIGLMGNYAYFCVFVDDYTQFVWVYCLKTKDEIRQAFKEF